MTTELTSTNGKAPHPVKSLESFTQRLHDAPMPSEIAENRQAGGAKYIPIGPIERKLDQVYFGLWETRNFRWQVVANEIIGSIELRVFHPVAREWITREGAGAAMIQLKSGSSVTDIEAKIKNTLAKDFPHLKSECIKNAAKSLGVFFGRNLNRNDAGDYEPYSDMIESGTHDDLLNALDSATSMAELGRIWKDNPDYANNPVAITAFSQAKKRLLK